MNRHTALRLALVAILLTTAYTLALWQPVRVLYGHGDKIAHGVAFTAVYAALAWALHGWRVWTLALLAAVLGAVSEIHQYFMPGFTPSILDWLADLSGIALAAFSYVAIKNIFNFNLYKI